MRFGGWLVVFIITLVMGGISFVSGEYGIYVIFLIIWIISVVGMWTSRKKSKSIEKAKAKSSTQTSSKVLDSPISVDEQCI